VYRDCGEREIKSSRELTRKREWKKLETIAKSDNCQRIQIGRLWLANLGDIWQFWHFWQFADDMIRVHSR
jgi:hypothetical protein